MGPQLSPNLFSNGCHPVSTGPWHLLAGHAPRQHMPDCDEINEIRPGYGGGALHPGYKALLPWDTSFLGASSIFHPCCFSSMGVGSFNGKTLAGGIPHGAGAPARHSGNRDREILLSPCHGPYAEKRWAPPGEYSW